MRFFPKYVREKVLRVTKIILKGRVFSGGGAGSLFVNLPWAKKQFKDKLGFDPYSGTLNLKLSSGTDAKELRSATKGIKIKSPEGFHEGRCFKADRGHRVVGVRRCAEIFVELGFLRCFLKFK